MPQQTALERRRARFGVAKILDYTPQTEMVKLQWANSEVPRENVTDQQALHEDIVKILVKGLKRERRRNKDTAQARKRRKQEKFVDKLGPEYDPNHSPTTPH
ncbi:hypothetical protein A4X13_0g7730 [Tilletia indica]|uniref:Uncharacterized protein n=1 Tax=Tilletia indica TaxID=43049 RepID=A0A177T6L1_9BASI|nr:hypothetical protein A4X13_0g7730 [Tilletia indica]